MGFTNQERINLNSKVLQAGVIDAAEGAVWFESRFANEFLVKPKDIFVQIESIPEASNLATAQSNAASQPDIIQDFSQGDQPYGGVAIQGGPGVGTAVRLTEVPGTNGSTFVAYETFNDTTSPVLNNWLLPQVVPQSSGIPSIGYSIQLYEGDPNAGGTLVSTTAGQTGSGPTRSVGWIFNYKNGLLLVSSDTRSIVTDPYILGFRYIGQGLEDLRLENLSDVRITGPITGQGLIYDGSGWVNTSIGIGATGPQGATGVQGTTGPQGVTGSAVGELNDLSDVTIMTPVTGEVLQYNGSTWENSVLSNISTSFTASFSDSSLRVGDVVGISGEDTVAPIDAMNVDTTAVGVCVALDTPSAGQCIVQVSGLTNFFQGPISLTAGRRYVLSLSKGDIIDVSDDSSSIYPNGLGTFQQVIGEALATNLFLIKIETPFELA